MKSPLIFLSVLILSSVIFFSCTKDEIVSPGSPYFEWTLFDSSANVSRIDITSDNALIYSGSSTNTYKVKNGVKTRFDFQDNEYWVRNVKYINSDYVGFIPWIIYPFDNFVIKIFDNGVLQNITLPNRNFAYTDFLILDKDNFLICGMDSLFYYKAGTLSGFKAPDSVRAYYLAQADGKVYVIGSNYSNSETKTYELNNTSFKFISNSNVRLFEGNITNKITGIRTTNGRYYFDYLTSGGWINFYSTDIANINTLAGSAINNFYFTGRDVQSGKYKGYFYDGTGTYSDENFSFNDSLGTSQNMLNNTIYKIKPGRTGSGINYIYKGEMKK